jgi:hypothetical protein
VVNGWTTGLCCGQSCVLKSGLAVMSSGYTCTLAMTTTPARSVLVMVTLQVCSQHRPRGMHLQQAR